jgi:hypothetical protein
MNRTSTTRTHAAAVAAGAGLALAAAANAGGPVDSFMTIDFASLSHGEIINSQFAGMPIGVEVSAENPNRPWDLAAAFDTTLTGTFDPDLEGPPSGSWSMGNIPANENLGVLAIISESGEDPNNPGFVTRPDDEGSRPAGALFFDFAQDITAFGFDLVDIESPLLESSELIFKDAGGDELASVQFAQFVMPGDAFFDPTIKFGNNSANRIQPITADALGIAGFRSVEMRIGGSAGVDNVRFVPTPGAVALLGLAGGLAATRRR